MLEQQSLRMHQDEKRVYRTEIKRHFDLGPRRDKRMDDYYYALKIALDNSLELPEKPVLDDEKE